LSAVGLVYKGSFNGRGRLSHQYLLKATPAHARRIIEISKSFEINVDDTTKSLAEIDLIEDFEDIDEPLYRELAQKLMDYDLRATIMTDSNLGTMLGINKVVKLLMKLKSITRGATTTDFLSQNGVELYDDGKIPFPDHGEDHLLIVNKDMFGDNYRFYTHRIRISTNPTPVLNDSFLTHGPLIPPIDSTKIVYPLYSIIPFYPNEDSSAAKKIQAILSRKFLY
jgi:hypothetical protein